MNINVSNKKERFLKKALNTDDIKSILQQVVDDWIEAWVGQLYKKRKKKSAEELIDELEQ